MDMATCILITQPKVYPHVMNKIFVKAVEKISESQGFNTLSFKSQEEGDYFPVDDLLARVD